MRHSSIGVKAILIASFFSLIVVAVALFIDKTYDDWASEVIQTNKVLCEVVARQLQGSAQPVIDSLYNSQYFSEGMKSNIETKSADKVLIKISSTAFKTVRGMEGGFFIIGLDQFQGYAYPTSPPPIPVFGPPPRSFNIIKRQVFKSIENDSSIVEMHQFDPAIFPLATVPVKVRDNIVGAVWTRTHIERELPSLKFNDIINITAVISLLGFFVAVFISIRLRSRLERICSDLEILEHEPMHRLISPPGMFGYISKSVNKMLDSLHYEQKNREILEEELHQQDKMASLGKLVARVAHEVKTPLAIIKTRIQMLQKNVEESITDDESLARVFKESLNLVINEVNRLTSLVNKLLIFSKPTDKNFIPVDINELVNDLLTLFRTKRYAARAVINFNPEENLPIVQANPDKIEQVLLNIITNAFEALKTKGKIDITTSIENGYVKLSIADNGFGIPEEVSGNIFDPFFTTKESGTGLGLSIAYEIMQVHKGKIEFVSNELQGSTFIISLPILQASVNNE